MTAGAIGASLVEHALPDILPERISAEASCIDLMHPDGGRAVVSIRQPA